MYRDMSVDIKGIEIPNASRKDRRSATSERSLPKMSHSVPQWALAALAVASIASLSVSGVSLARTFESSLSHKNVGKSPSLEHVDLTRLANNSLFTRWRPKVPLLLLG